MQICRNLVAILDADEVQIRKRCFLALVDSDRVPVL
jgi:hypothetical protein